MPTPSTSKRRVPLAIHSFRRALDVNRFETFQHRRKRLEAAALNIIAPISSLPPEILCHIFLFYASASPLHGLGWLAVTHVIHHWRAVALACPELWANLILHRKLMPMMLVRSKEAPLIVRVDLNYRTHLTSRHIRESIARVGVLDVRGSQHALDAFFVDHVGKSSAPRLRSLSVVNLTTAGDPLWLDARVFHSAEKRMGHIPRQLRLEKCALPWNSPWYSNLTNLHLANFHKAHSPTITMLFSVIISSPLLQHLTLINTQTRVDGLDRSFPFALRNLRSIRVSEPISVCAQILMNLTFPSVLAVDVCCLPAPEFPETHGSLVDTVLCHRDFCQTYNFLRIDAPTRDCFRIDTSSYSTDKTLRIEIHHGARPPSLGPALHNLVKYSNIFFSRITTLHVNTVALGNDSWRHLCKCRNLATLTLQTVDPLPILTLLLECAMRCIGVSVRPEFEVDIDPNGVRRQLFPELRCIELNDIDCGNPYPSITDVLRSLLWARRTGRCPIPRVRVEACKNVFQQDLDYLRFLTNSFFWDGVGWNPGEKEDGGYIDVRSFSLNVFENLHISRIY